MMNNAGCRVQPAPEPENTMSKKALNLSAIVLATTLTGCSSFMSSIGQFGSLNDGHPMPSDVKDQTTAEIRNQVSDAYGPIAITADTVAMRLKEKFSFVSDEMWLSRSIPRQGRMRTCQLSPKTSTACQEYRQEVTEWCL